MLARFSQLFRSLGRVISRIWPKSKAFSVLSFFGLAVVALGVLGLAEPAQAFFTEFFNAILWAFSAVMFLLARLFIGLTIFFLKFFIEVAQYNNFIGTSTVKVGWFLVRDVANMFFVIILLVISFGTILGIEQYEWKKTLVKLILAAVFINFSNMIAQLIIDAAHVFTITFVNAISATAGGNLIQMFNIDKVYEITGAEKFSEGADLKMETFAASVAVFFLAFIMMATMGAYSLVMVARMVVLWVLIILSPLAYIFQVLPQTQKYAQEWWSTFINHVIVAPVMVFFLWLSFATLNDKSHGIKVDAQSTQEATDVVDDGVQFGKKKLSISDASSWENMANYLIAIAFLLVGLRKVRELGVEAGGLTSSVTGFAKKVGTIASGYAVGRAIYDKGAKATKEHGGKFLANATGNLPGPLGWKSWRRAGKRANDWRKNAPALRAIPLLGNFISGYSQEYNEKMDDRVDKVVDHSKKERMKDLSKTGPTTSMKVADALPNLITKRVGQALEAIGGEKLTGQLGIQTWAKAGTSGLKAATARRNMWEAAEHISVTKRSAINRQTRNTDTELNELAAGMGLIREAMDDEFDKFVNGFLGGSLEKMLEAIGQDEESFSEDFEGWLDQDDRWNSLSPRKQTTATKAKFRHEYMRAQLKDATLEGDNDSLGDRFWKENRKEIDQVRRGINKSSPTATLAEKNARNGAQVLLGEMTNDVLQKELGGIKNKSRGQILEGEMGKVMQIPERTARADEDYRMADAVSKRMQSEEKIRQYKKANRMIKEVFARGGEGGVQLLSNAMRKDSNLNELRALDEILKDAPELRSELVSANTQPFVRAAIVEALATQQDRPLQYEKAELESTATGELVERPAGMKPNPSDVRWNGSLAAAKAQDLRDEGGKGAVGGYLFARAFGKQLKGEELNDEEKRKVLEGLAAGTSTHNFDDQQSGLGTVVQQFEEIEAMVRGEGVTTAADLSDASKKELQLKYGKDRALGMIDNYEYMEQTATFAKDQNMVTVVQDMDTKKLVYGDNSGWDNTGFMEHFLVTGDLQFAKAFRGASELMRAASMDEEIEDLSSIEALQLYFSDENAANRSADNVTNLNSVDDFIDRLGSFAHLEAFGSNTKETASGGHWNNGAHVLPDENGDVQLRNPYEAMAIMLGTARKSDKNFEPQASGAIQRGRSNTGDYMQMMSRDFFQGSNIVAATNHTAWNRAMKNKIRNIREIGNGSRGRLKETDTETGAGKYGGNASHISSVGYGDYEFGLMSHMIGNALPVLVDGGNTFAFAQQSEFANLAQPMDFAKGFVNATYAGTKEHFQDLNLGELGYDSTDDLDFGHTADMADFVHRFLSTRMAEINERMGREIAEAEAAMKVGPALEKDGTTRDKRWVYAIKSQLQANKEYLEDNGGDGFINELSTRADSMRQQIPSSRKDKASGRTKIAKMTDEDIAGNPELAAAKEQQEEASKAMETAHAALANASGGDKQSAQAAYDQAEAAYAAAMARTQDIYMATAPVEELEKAATEADAALKKAEQELSNVTSKQTTSGEATAPAGGGVQAMVAEKEAELERAKQEHEVLRQANRAARDGSSDQAGPTFFERVDASNKVRAAQYAVEHAKEIAAGGDVHAIAAEKEAELERANQELATIKQADEAARDGSSDQAGPKASEIRSASRKAQDAKMQSEYASAAAATPAAPAQPAASSEEVQRAKQKVADAKVAKDEAYTRVAAAKAVGEDGTVNSQAAAGDSQTAQEVSAAIQDLGRQLEGAFDAKAIAQSIGDIVSGQLQSAIGNQNIKDEDHEDKSIGAEIAKLKKALASGIEDGFRSQRGQSTNAEQRELLALEQMNLKIRSLAHSLTSEQEKSQAHDPATFELTVQALREVQEKILVQQTSIRKKIIVQRQNVIAAEQEESEAVAAAAAAQDAADAADAAAAQVTEEDENEK